MALVVQWKNLNILAIATATATVVVGCGGRF